MLCVVVTGSGLLASGVAQSLGMLMIFTGGCDDAALTSSRVLPEASGSGNEALSL